MLESKFQADLIKELKDLFPGCIILKNDSSYLQGIPDLLMLYKTNWAALECKRSAGAPTQANQQWYVELMNDMSFAAIVFPENRKEIINALLESFGISG